MDRGIPPELFLTEGITFKAKRMQPVNAPHLDDLDLPVLEQLVAGSVAELQRRHRSASEQRST